MGGFLGFLGSIFSSIAGLGAGALKAAAIIALDVGAALLGGSTTVGEKLKNKTIASSTYGRPIPRCRGTVRLQGQLIFWNGIQETTHKQTGGGFLGIGQHSVYTYTYATCAAFAFGKKLGGGEAVKFIRIWADGKLLYSGLVSDASLVGTATIVGTVASGTQAIPISMSGGGSDALTLSAGDLIHFSSEPQTDYEVQQDVTIASGATGQVDVYPPLDVDLTGDTISIPGLNAPLVDLSSFDPNPHDGSHVTANPVPSGFISFHYGSPTEQPDPIMVKQFGAGQAAAYRGLPYVMLTWLQLANYGNHLPSISAELSFDTATSKHPVVGPVSGVALYAGGGRFCEFLIPSLQASALRFRNPSTILPYMWVVTGSSSSALTLYKIDSRSNVVLSSIVFDTTGGLVSPFVIDDDGYIYFSSGGFSLFKYDGQGMKLEAVTGAALYNNILPWDFQASCFGNPVEMKFLFGNGGGNIYPWDRKTLLPLGTANALSAGWVISQYSSSGKPQLTLGDPLVLAGGDGDMVADSTGNVWAVIGANLIRYDCQPQSMIDINQLPNIVPIMMLPSFDGAIVDVSSITTGPGHASTLFYSSYDNSIVVLGDNGLCKVSCDTFAITQTNTATPPWSGGAVAAVGSIADGVSTFLVTNGGGTDAWRYSTATLELLTTYNLSGDFAVAGPGRVAYDGMLNSVWWNSGGDLVRLYLDRAIGDNIGLDSLVASIFDEAGYDSSEYDVTALATISTGGFEVDQEPYLDSIKKLQQLFLFDMAEIDGVIVCVPRSSGLGAVTIPEDDLGATDIGTAPAARLSETLQQETDVPSTVWVQYYDTTKELQQATQYDKRIARPYASALSGNPNVTNSRNQLSISIPVTDSPGPMKQQARSILLDAWQARMRYQFKTGPKYIRLDPTDKLQITYKGQTLDARLTQVDRGAGMALEFQGESYDSEVYTVPAAVTQPGGNTPSGVQPPPPVVAARDNYTILPVYPITQTSTTTLALAATVASFDSGFRTQYEPRPSLAIADPGSGLTKVYYVTIYDPLFVGEVPGTISLTCFCDSDPAAAHVGELGYINMGSIVAAGAGAIVEEGQAAGQPFPLSGVLVGEVAFGPTTRGHNIVPHNLGFAPSSVIIHVNTAIGEEIGIVALGEPRYDAINIYLEAAVDGTVGFLELFA